MDDPVLAALLNAPRKTTNRKPTTSGDAVSEGMADLAAERMVSSAEILDDIS